MTSTTAAKLPTQQAKMIELYLLNDRDAERTIADYAAAERAGLVLRKSNKHGWSAEKYAARLFADGMAKGWLR